MKNIISILLIIIFSAGLISCGSKNNTTTASTNQTGTSSQEKIYQAGEKAFITDDKGNKCYSLKIDSVTNYNEDIKYYKDKYPNIKQLIKINYTYNNIAKNDEAKLEISPNDFQILDSNNSVCECVWISDYPKIGVGINASAEGRYVLTHESNKIKIIFESKQYKKVVAFDIEIK